MMLSCIIIDDERHAIEELAELIDHMNNVCVLNTFQNVKSAVSFLQDIGHVDVVFCDINMSALNGIEAARILSSHTDFLVYVTAHRDYAVDAFSVNADGYLVKPVSYTLLAQQVDGLIQKRSLHRETSDKNYDVLFLKGGQKNSFIKIRYNDIIYIEALLNYVIVHTVGGNEVTHVGLKGMEQILKHKDFFFRISKSAIVSINFLDRVDGNTVRLKDKNYFTIGEKYRSAFHEFLRKRTLNP